MTEHVFDTGGVWEGDGFCICKDYENESDEYVPCKHAHSPHIIVHERLDKTTWENKAHIVPFVVVQVNEGGYSTTGTCVQCILEAFETIK